MFKIVYDPHYGQVVPDGDIESFVMENVRNHSKIAKVYVGSETMFTRFRLAVARGELDTDNVGFYFNNELIPHRPDGTLVRWPKGLGDYEMQYIRELTTIRRHAADKNIAASYLTEVQ